MEALYTTKTLATLLQVSPSTIRREIGEGRITCFRVRGQIRFRESDVQRYLKSGRFQRRQMQSAEVVYLPFKHRKPAGGA